MLTSTQVFLRLDDVTGVLLVPQIRRHNYKLAKMMKVTACIVIKYQLYGFIFNDAEYFAGPVRTDSYERILRAIRLTVRCVSLFSKGKSYLAMFTCQNSIL